MKLLDENYEFASCLATDVKATNYVVDNKSINISPSSINECGFVVRVYKNGKYYEYSFNELAKNKIDEIVASIDKLVNSETKIENAHTSLIKEEALVKNFVRKQTGKEYSSQQIINTLGEYVKYGLSLDERVINTRAQIEFSEYSKMYISKQKQLTQYYTWINPRCLVMVKNDKTMKYAYDGFGCIDTEEALAKLKQAIESSEKLAIELLDASLPIPGKYTIITDPSITGLIAHEAFGHGLEMDQFVKHRAKSMEYMHKQVASKLVNMHDGAKAAISSGSYKLVAKTHRLAYVMKATFLWLDFNIEKIYKICITQKEIFKYV